MRVWIPALVFAGLAGLFWVAIFGVTPGQLPSALIGKPVPVFDLPPIDGMEGAGLSHRDFLAKNTAGPKGEVKLLNVWASWCVPCRQEHAFLSALRDRGVPVYGLNYKDAPAAARAFLAELGNPYVQIGADAQGVVGIEWGVYGVPETFVIDAQGVIAFKHVGPIDEVVLAQVLWPAIEAARAGAGAPTQAD